MNRETLPGSPKNEKLFLNGLFENAICSPLCLLTLYKKPFSRTLNIKETILSPYFCDTLYVKASLLQGPPNIRYVMCGAYRMISRPAGYTESAVSRGEIVRQSWEYLDGF